MRACLQARCVMPPQLWNKNMQPEILEHAVAAQRVLRARLVASLLHIYMFVGVEFLTVLVLFPPPPTASLTHTASLACLPSCSFLPPCSFPLLGAHVFVVLPHAYQGACGMVGGHMLNWGGPGQHGGFQPNGYMPSVALANMAGMILLVTSSHV